jgi:uncharacterized phage protein gp47/JayE
MSIYGLTSAGFVAKSLEDIKAEYEGDFTAGFGTGTNLEPESINGQLIGIFAERDAEIWEALLELVSSIDPDQAVDVAQDTLAGITGTIRHLARASTTTVLAVGTPGTVLLSGRVFSVVGSGVRFASGADTTLAAATAWAGSTTYATGAIVTNAGKVFYATTGGASAASGGPTGTGAGITDGTVVWRCLGAGSGVAAVPVAAQVTGAKPANAWSLATVETAVSGLDSVSNPTDAVLGADLETGGAFRVRREAELQSSGLSAVEAIRGNILQVPLVTQAFVFENTDPVNTNSDGVPPNAVEVVVQGGDDTAVRAAVFASKGAGITAYGSNTGTVVDSMGISHAVAFSRPGQLLAYLAITVATDVHFPVDGAAQIIAALDAWALANLDVGADLHQSQLFGPIFTVPGVVDVPVLYLGTSASPTTTTPIVTGSRQQILLDTSRIAVTVT